MDDLRTMSLEGLGELLRGVGVSGKLPIYAELRRRDEAVRKLIEAATEHMEAQRIAWDERPDDEQGTQREWNEWGPIEQRRDSASDALRSALAAFEEPART